MTTDTAKLCQKCGANIPPEHFTARMAGMVSGKLMCAGCVDSLRKEIAASRSGLLRVTGSAGAQAESGDVHDAIPPATLATAAVMPREAPAPVHDEPIALIADSDAPTRATIQLGARAGPGFGGGHDDSRLKRPLAATAQGATRVRTFHARISDGAMNFLDSQINDWLEAHPDIFIKFVSTTVGPFEAKQHMEHHLIVSLFY